MGGLFRFPNWNEYNLNPLTRIHWRASLVPAAAVIPAPIAYIKVVAVKKLVVGLRACCTTRPLVVLVQHAFLPASAWALHWVCAQVGMFTVNKLECSKQAIAVNTLAWNNRIGLWFYFVGFWDRSND
eukprot:Plantae.Rhodophyta-Rhodochaete_pulchella.ctg751.p1 GENE.Plantae.Rhodophyta-Rhodochaete_pulchella.ctg751~~Plantae.Rhodophyta-Rhodochaete_pulchella.ctg751.p1  ORF type:complete len:127 (+),score=2.79 Plantae.Rhodophyta-Rhodochaete_pulchella.ctg751:800-1180(+)